MIAEKSEIIEQKKVHLISLITQIYNYDLLDKVEDLLLNSKTDWWTTLSETEKSAIDEGLADIKNGNVISHKAVIQEINRKFNNL